MIEYDKFQMSLKRLEEQHANQWESDASLPGLIREPEQNGRVSYLREALEESSLPFRVDLFVWDTVPEQFRKHIEAEHVVLRSIQMSIAQGREVSSEWQEVRWGDLATLEYGRALRGYDTARGPVRVFGTNGPIGWNDEALCSYPSVIVGRKGAYRGIHYSSNPFFAIDTAFYLKPKREMDVRWAYYQLLTQDINGMDSGSAIPSTSRDEFYSLPLLLPPLSEQRAIAHILGTLDDKIELNRRMNETLEAMARALFKSWFVDFEPVRAKMEGRDTGLPQHLADLFPDRMVESELGEIPEGWEVKSLAETVEIIGGGTPRTSVPHYWDGDIPWFSVVDAPTQSEIWVVDTAKKITQIGIENSSARILPVGTTIISARGTVGRIALVGVPMAMNQSCYGLRRSGPTHGLFNYFTIRALVVLLQQHTHGSVFNTITRDTLATVYVVSPCSDILDAYERLVWPAFERIRSGLFQSRTLVTIRDTLLPKLISGEIRIRPSKVQQLMARA